MHELTSWLREQIAADESAARATDPYDRPHAPGCAITADQCPACDCECADDVLARCEAHLRIIDAVVATWNNACDPTDDFWVGLAPMMRAVLRNLGSAYQQRLGYRHEWRP